MKQIRFISVVLIAASAYLATGGANAAYFPEPESQGDWRKLTEPESIRRTAVMDPVKLDDLRQWLLQSDERNFAAVVIRRGHIVLEVERGNSAKTDSRRVASVSKAVCATVLAIAAEQSRQGLTPHKMTFDDPAFDFIPWAQPLSDPRKAQITVKQLLNHTSGLCPEATGARNDGTWEYILGHSGDARTAKLAFDPGTACGYSTHALHHAALVCETVTGKPYDQFAIEALFRPLGIERWWFQYFDGGEGIGRHPTHGLGMPARDLARIAYCMLQGGRWDDRQVIPAWFVEETAAATHNVRSPEMRWKINPQTFSHGWELAAVRSAPAEALQETPHGGIPTDARYKPGSGGQLIAFVPSLDLVITRQTGGSGDWAYEEYLRRACAAAMPVKAAVAEGPCPPSPVIADMVIDWATHQRHAQGSDNFQLTWADDDHQYGAWGDGGGFGGTNSDGRVGLGLARIEGDWDNYRGFNVWGGKDPENPARFTGKSWGTICVDGALYSWIVPDVPDRGGPRDHYRYIELARSTDHGASWTKAPWRWRREDNLLIPTFLVYGKNNAGASDDYVYSYFIRPQDVNVTQSSFGLEVHKPGVLFLARVHRDRIFDGRDAYEWFTGIRDGEPTWGPLAEKRPVFENPDGTGWCVSASYNPGLGRYLLATEHSASHSGVMSLFDAPQPWGPWTTVKYWTTSDRFGKSRSGSKLDWADNIFFFSFAPKWLSADGRNFTLVFTGGGSGKDNDSMNTVRGVFQLQDPFVQ